MSIVSVATITTGPIDTESTKGEEELLMPLTTEDTSAAASARNHSISTGNIVEERKEKRIKKPRGTGAHKEETNEEYVNREQNRKGNEENGNVCNMLTTNAGSESETDDKTSAVAPATAVSDELRSSEAGREGSAAAEEGVTS
jgi:hypothetical protein